MDTKVSQKRKRSVKISYVYDFKGKEYNVQLGPLYIIKRIIKF